MPIEQALPAVDDPRVGTTLLGKLLVIRRLGAGGGGVVYEVEHQLTRHRRALKVLRSELATSGEAVARMVREARAAGQIESPCVVETYDVGRLPDGATYVLMELAPGRSLRAILDEVGRLPAARAAAIVARVCEGLEAVHAAGIVHRDLKPENLLVDGEEAGAPRVKILDFGMLKLVAGEGDTFGALTAAGAAAGTVGYMAPEQIEGAAVDARTDVHALGVVLHEALAGRPPFAGKSAAAIAVAIRRGAPPLAEAAPDVDPALAAVVARAMHRDPEERYASASALREALSAFASAPAQRVEKVFADRYAIVRLLRAGGMGAVYEAIDRRTGGRCALKTMLPAAVARDDLRLRFEAEATIAAGIADEHVVAILDAGVDADTGTPFLAMELLEGADLGAVIEERGPLPAAEVVDRLAQVARALDAVHAARIVHRDLKPENLFLTSAGCLKILDFGVAKIVEEARAAGATCGSPGTPLYMAPEQIEGAGVGPAADRYALAQIAFTLLTGEAYWKDEARAGLVPLLAKLARGPKEPASARAARRGVTLPNGFDAWFAKATHVAMGARFASASAEVAALAQAFAPVPAQRASRRATRSIALAIAAGVAAIGVARMVGAHRAVEVSAAVEPVATTRVTQPAPTASIALPPPSDPRPALTVAATGLPRATAAPARGSAASTAKKSAPAAPPPPPDADPRSTPE